MVFMLHPGSLPSLNHSDVKIKQKKVITTQLRNKQKRVSKKSPTYCIINEEKISVSSEASMISANTVGNAKKVLILGRNAALRM